MPTRPVSNLPIRPEDVPWPAHLGTAIEPPPEMDLPDEAAPESLPAALVWAAALAVTVFLWSGAMFSLAMGILVRALLG